MLNSSLNKFIYIYIYIMLELNRNHYIALFLCIFNMSIYLDFLYNNILSWLYL